MLEDKDLRSIQEVRTKVDLAYEAFQKYRSFSQEQVDRIIDHVAAVARANAESLARLAVEETRYGNVKDKVAKNLLNSDTLHQAIRPLKTAGIVREDRANGIIEIAEPVGVVAAILPTTNPTSTAFFKILISLKARNAIVISPHPRAVRCTCEAARLLYEAAVEAGAPEHIVECIGDASIQGTNELMKHRRTALILSTGGAGIVRAAYSSGKPALGVGPGNVPVLLESSADIDSSVASVVLGKSFDYGTVCSSEQTLVAEHGSRERVMGALKANKAHICTPEQTAALSKLLVSSDFRINPDCVGQSPLRIAEMAGFQAAPDTSILVVEIQGVGREHPLSAEKLSPVLSVYFVRDFEESVKACTAILNFGGRGHTCVIYSKNDQRIQEYGLRAPAFRVLVNTSSPQGSTGITTNVFPSMTLGCGAIAGNVTSDNVGPMHLINIKRIAFHVRDAQSAFQSEEAKAYFAGQSLPASAAPAACGTAMPKIAEAVGRYLAQRGIAAPASAAPAASTAASFAPAPRAAAPHSAALANPAASVVDRFLARRGGGNPGVSSGFASNPSSASLPSASPAASLAPPAPQVEVVPFVAEDDVRRARFKQQKIYINAKTIVTPAARDLDDGTILVRTE
jgi:acyl-CoA reductase-like NAD-dependent aldehyde dehydrogenase